MNPPEIVATLPDGSRWTIRRVPQVPGGYEVRPLDHEPYAEIVAARVAEGVPTEDAALEIAALVRREGEAVLGYIRSRWLTPREYAARHRRFEASVRASIKAGTLPALKLGRAYRIDPDAPPPRPGVRKR